MFLKAAEPSGLSSCVEVEMDVRMISKVLMMVWGFMSSEVGLT